MADRTDATIDSSLSAPWPKDRFGMENRARDLFARAKQANDPDTRDVLSAAAWYYADKAERKS